ncbi:MAG TPA: alpha/beta hydrolase [Planctomycetota bacterium]|jgi:hypothetical protein
MAEQSLSPPVTPAKPPPKPFLAWYWRVLRIVILSYLGILVFLYFAQRKLIFVGMNTQGHAPVAPRPGIELLPLTTAAREKVFAAFGPALMPDDKADPQAAQRPTIIFCYGNAMCLRDAMQELNALRRLGANVIIPEYVGYGISSGEASESGCYAAADAAYEHLLTRKDIDPSKIISCGWSLGAAVAIDLASRKPVAALATFSAFSSMAAEGNATYPFLPTLVVSMILRHRFDSISKIGSVKCPILIGHGKQDEMIPYAMADALAAAAKSSVTRLAIEGANHNDVFGAGLSQVEPAMHMLLEKAALAPNK